MVESQWNSTGSAAAALFTRAEGGTEGQIGQHKHWQDAKPTATFTAALVTAGACCFHVSLLREGVWIAQRHFNLVHVQQTKKHAPPRTCDMKCNKGSHMTNHSRSKDFDGRMQN